MKKTTFLKTLLMAVGLFMGTSAMWAQKVYTPVWSNDLSTSTGWSIGANCHGNITTNNALVADDSYLNVKCDNGKNRDNTYSLTSANANFASTTDYTFEFDLAIYGSNANNNLAHFYLVGTNPSSETVNVFTIDCESYSTFQLNAGTAITAQAIDVTANAKSTRDNVGAATVWYHYTVVSNATDGTSLKVEKWDNGSKTSAIATTKVSNDFIKLTQVNLHAGSYMQFSIDNMALAVYSDEVLDPSASITAVNGNSRTVTMTQAQGYDIYYYETDDTYDITGLVATQYTTPLSISENKYYVIYGKNGETVSDNVQVSFEAGTPITLNGVAWTKTAYNSGTGVSTVRLSCDQTNLLCNPPATIHYSLTSGAEGDIANGETVDVTDGDTFSFYAKAAGYTNSATKVLVANAPCTLPEVLNESFASSADKLGISKGDLVTTVNTINYYKMVAETDGIVSENFLMGYESWPGMMYRTGGIYNQGGANYLIKNVKNGDYVTITFSKGDAYPTTSDGTLDEWNSTNTSYSYNVTATHGNFRIYFARYAYVKSIRVNGAPVTKTITSAGWATYCSPYALDFSSSIANLTKAYLVTGATGNTLNLAEITGTVPANTGILLEGEGAVTIPVVASSSTDVSANKLVGVTANTEIAAEAGYVLMGSPRVGFYMNNNAFTVGANTAYLSADFAAARMAFFGFDDEATGVQNLTPALSEGEGVVYNLRGQRVAQPTKGLYIVNGKKVVIK